MRNTFDYFDGDIYLEHHGILGQKWGVRRYQNKDGSLTSEGQKRYNKKGAKGIKGFDEKAYEQYSRSEKRKMRQNRSDAENERELRSAYKTWEKEDFDENGADEKQMVSLFKEIYNGPFGGGRPSINGIPAVRKILSDSAYERADLSRKDFQKIELDVCGEVLKDLGFKDTELNRRYIYGMTWDQANLPLDKAAN